MELQSLSVMQGLMLVGPAVTLFFALCFAWLWRNHGRQRCVMFFGLAFLLFSGTAILQILRVLPQWGVSTVLAGILYASSAWLLANGCACRAGRRNFPPALYVGLLAVLGVALYALHYVYPQASAQGFVLNASCGIALSLALFRMDALRNGPHINRMLYWVYSAFALGFFVRAGFAVNGPLGGHAAGLDDAVYELAVNLSMMFFIVALAVLMMIAIFNERIEELRRDRDRDVLTSILNRRGFFNYAQGALKRRGSLPSASLLILDLDYFKSINDLYGHAVGDAALVEVGQVIQRTVRHSDIAGRIGGEEFAILLPDTDIAGARELAERLRVSLMKAHFPGLPKTHTVTASIGVVTGKLSDTLDTLLDRADGLLYEAKKVGRNRIMLAA